MAAVAEYVMTQWLDPIDRAALRRELSRWGAWEDKVRAFNGYPSSDNVQRSIMGAGGGLGGHRILMLERPVDVYSTHQAWLRLPEDLKALVEALFVGIMRPDGELIDFAERSARVNLSERTARRKLEKAMIRMAGLGDGEELD